MRKLASIKVVALFVVALGLIASLNGCFNNEIRPNPDQSKESQDKLFSLIDKYKLRNYIF